jgi:hypothetical protein
MSDPIESTVGIIFVWAVRLGRFAAAAWGPGCEDFAFIYLFVNLCWKLATNLDLAGSVLI